MADDIDYEELADNTISDIKDEVEGRDIDFQKLLEAEENNKDRKTLKEWLQRRIDGTERYEKDEVEEGYEKEPVVESEGGGSLWTRPSTNFILGILVGIAAAALVIGSGSGGISGQATLSPQDASDQVSQFVDDTLLSQLPSNLSADASVGEVDTGSYSDVYVVPLEVTAQGQTQTMQFYVTRDSQLLFTQPFDLETGQPVGGAQVQPTP